MLGHERVKRLNVADHIRHARRRQRLTRLCPGLSFELAEITEEVQHQDADIAGIVAEPR